MPYRIMSCMACGMVQSFMLCHPLFTGCMICMFEWLVASSGTTAAPTSTTKGGWLFAGGNSDNSATATEEGSCSHLLLLSVTCVYFVRSMVFLMACLTFIG